METISLQIRIPRDLRDAAGAVLEEVGMDMTTAVRVYLKKIVKTRKIPFPISADDSPAAEYVVVDEETRQMVEEIGEIWKKVKSASEKK